MAPLLIVLYLGGWWLWAAALIIALMGIHEFCNGWENLDVHPSKMICYVMTAILFCGTFLTGAFTKNAEAVSVVPPYYHNMMLMAIWLFVAVAAAMIYGWKINERGPYDSIATIAAMVYIPFFTYHMVLIAMTEYKLFIWIVIIAAFGSDIFAYFTGYFLGKHKMAPNLSPKKTIEGAVGGLVGSLEYRKTVDANNYVVPDVHNHVLPAGKIGNENSTVADKDRNKVSIHRIVGANFVGGVAGIADTGSDIDFVNEKDTN